MRVGPHDANESGECPGSLRLALGDRPSPLATGLSANAARNALPANAFLHGLARSGGESWCRATRVRLRPVP